MKDRTAGRFGSYHACISATLLIVALVSASRGAVAGDLPIELSNVQAARVLFKAGRRLQHALELLKRAQPTNEEEKIEQSFLLGLIEARLGLLRDAARRFETILVRGSHLTRVRLKLARVYYALGWDEKARPHFEASLVDELPSSVEKLVDAFLDRIDARKSWSVHLSSSVVIESNPLRRTDSQEILIGSVPFQLSEDVRDSSGVGFLVSVGASFSPVTTDDLRGILAAAMAAKRFRQLDWSETSVRGEIGLARLLDGGAASAGLRLGQRRLEGDLYRSEIGPWMRGRLELFSNGWLDLYLGVENRDHPKRRD